MTGINEVEIRKAISLIKPNGELFEVRFISGKWNASGYFTDANTLITELRKFRPKAGANVYVLLNHIKDECYSRKQRDRFIELVTPTTSDHDVDGLEWIMIDLDPIRAAGTSSTDNQLLQARNMAKRIFAFMRNRLWNDPIVASSGNGIHLLYKIMLKNTPDRVKLIENCLKTLNMIFKDDAIDIDLKTFNPARVCKLYGTMAQKGSNTPERPHRMSSIIYAPEKLQTNDVRLLEELIKLLPQEEKPQKYNNYDPQRFDVQDWLNHHNIAYTSKVDWNGGTKWILEHCPFNDQHTGKDASVIQTQDGKLCFNCFHSSCSDKKWKDLREMYEPDAYTRRETRIIPNYLARRQNPATLIRNDVEEPVFYTTEQIRTKENPPEEFIRCGISEIDKRMRGLKKGFVSVMSGLRASGKSSLISQMALECRQQGYKVAIYSGELTAKNLLNWLALQAAGKAHVHPTSYENFFKPNDNIEELVSKWLDDFVFVYNNDYGNNFEYVMENIRKCVEEHSVDFIILDNLMALDIESLDSDKYARQSKFVGILEIFAKQNNVHILFVAHPRKSNGFLRLDDISGSNDIVNRVDNAFIVHRVNEDFKRLTGETMRWKSDNPLYEASNVIEICKDRDGGNQDIFIPLVFEPETKRLKNAAAEYIHYGWENSYNESRDIDDLLV